MRHIVLGEFDPVMPDPGGGLFALFPVFFVLVLVLGVGTTIYKVSTARRMARNAGLDEDDATAVALLGDPGLSTAYLASSLRGDRGEEVADAPAPAPPSTADRLRELQQLRDQGLITVEEHDARRRAIIESV